MKLGLILKYYKDNKITYQDTIEFDERRLFECLDVLKSHAKLDTDYRTAKLVILENDLEDLNNYLYLENVFFSKSQLFNKLLAKYKRHTTLERELINIVEEMSLIYNKLKRKESKHC